MILSSENLWFLERKKLSFLPDIKVAFSTSGPQSQKSNFRPEIKFRIFLKRKRKRIHSIANSGGSNEAYLFIYGLFNEAS
jgi:hypothetical protein